MPLGLSLRISLLHFLVILITSSHLILCCTCHLKGLFMQCPHSFINISSCIDVLPLITHCHLSFTSPLAPILASINRTVFLLVVSKYTEKNFIFTTTVNPTCGVLHSMYVCMYVCMYVRTYRSTDILSKEF